MLVFAYVPALASMPTWLWFELHNPANLREPVILAFLPIRGFLALLDGFYAGAIPGILAGCVQGLLLSAWCWMRGSISPWRRSLALGALAGLVAASVVTFITRIGPDLVRGAASPRDLPIPFEVASGLVCGLLAAPMAVRLLLPAAPGETADLPA